jgi:hypothetical protein
MEHLICGVGFNDALYVRGEQTKRCPFYRRWKAMMFRCYTTTRNDSIRSYDGCKVDVKWHRFTAFRDWMNEQQWAGMHLDKDLLGRGRRYSESECVFVPPAVNLFTTERAMCRGIHPLGVSFHRGNFLATIRKCGKKKFLGYYQTAWDAHSRWAEEKSRMANELADAQDVEKVANALRVYAARIVCNAETFARTNAALGLLEGVQ